MNSTSGYYGNISTVIRPQYYTHDSQGHQVLGWNVPTDEDQIVHPYWRGFEAPPMYFHILFFIIYLVFFIVSAFGNGMVVYIFSTSKSLRTPSNLFVVNLSLFDICMLVEMPMFLINTVNGRIYGGEYACNVYAILGSVSGVGAGIANAAIAFDRYKTITSPLEGRLNFFQAGLLVFLTWMWTIPFTALPYLKVWGSFTAEGFLTTCSVDYLSDDPENKAFMVTIFLWFYCFPQIIICTCYTKLYLHVRQHEKMLQEQAKKMNVKSLSQNPAAVSAEMRIMKIALKIWFLYICAWTPYGAVALIGSFGDRTLITPFSSMIPALFSKTVSCIDPWIYAMNHPKYRQELEKKIPWLGIREPDDSVAAKSTNSDATAAENA